MMYLIEALFDTAYLGLILALGLRLLVEEQKEAKRFGWMAIILGLGDAFHLLPRILSNLTVNGFAQYLSLLSWGEFVTGITMTIFYILFYHYYRSLSGDFDKRKDGLIYTLAAIRLILVLLPQNQWGTSGNYCFGILRNIPFALMGLFLILWTWKQRKKEGLNNTSLLIAASFLFYLPVVFGARFVPALGALMMPKTIAYVLLVLSGFRYFIKDFTPDNLLKDSAVCLFMGLAGGVFYREFTKYFAWKPFTALSVVHVHLIALGFLTLLILYAVMRTEGERMAEIKTPLALYLTGLTWTVVSFMVRGIYSITSPETELFPDGALSGMAGIGHILLGLGIVWMILKLIGIKSESPGVEGEKAS